MYISNDFGNGNNSTVQEIDQHIPYSRKIRRELYLVIWPPNAEIKYWRNLNLAICDCEAKFH